MLFLCNFGFSLSAHVIAWRECWLSTPVSCVHGIVHLDCWSIKIFFLLGVLSALIFILWGFYPLDAFFRFWLFSVCKRDRMTRMLIVHTCIMWSWDHTNWLLEYYNIFSFGFFVRFDFYPLVLSSYGAFCPFSLFSVPHHDRMRRMLIVHTCIMWSWDRTPWLLEYYKYFLFWVFCPIWFVYPLVAFVIWCFCSF